MSAYRRISEGKLAEFWRVYPQTMITWRNDGQLDSDVKEDASNGYHHYYYIRTVEAYHLAHATGFGPDRPVPGFSQLLRSEPALLTAGEAAERLDCSVESLLASVRRGDTPAFHLGEESVRLPAALISMLASSQKGAVNVDVAAHILCVKPTTVQILMRNGQLKPIKETGKGKTRHVERNSLLALLARHIPDYIQPEIWWHKTLQSANQPLTKGQLVAQYHVHKRTVGRLVAEQSRSLPYIRTTGDRPRTIIPSWGVQTFLREEREQLTPQELAAILGVGAEQAADWRRTHALCKRPHGQAWHRCPTRSCIREYMVTHSTHAGLDVDGWLTTTLQLGVAAMSSDELIAATPSLKFSDIEQGLGEGMFTDGIWLPPQNSGGSLALHRLEAMDFQSVWRLQQK